MGVDISSLVEFRKAGEWEIAGEVFSRDYLGEYFEVIEEL